VRGVPALVKWVKDPTAATWVAVEARVQFLAWELPYSVGVAKKKKRKKRKNRKVNQKPPVINPPPLI